MPLPRETRSYSVDPRRVAAEFASLPGNARRILRLCDGVRGDGKICAASPLSRDVTLQILGRLEKLGLIVAGPAPGARVRARVSTPTSVQRWIAGDTTRAASDPMEATARVPAEVASRLARPLAPAAPAPPPAPHFSREEEDFFARSVEVEAAWTAEDEAALR